jgi:hypothetical protein
MSCKQNTESDIIEVDASDCVRRIRLGGAETFETLAGSLPFVAGPIGLTSNVIHQELAGKIWPCVFMVSVAPEHLPAYKFPGCDAWRNGPASME